MYEIHYKDNVTKLLGKLSKKSPSIIRIVKKKVEEIKRNPHHYKNLRSPLQRYKGVHIDNSFVLIFTVEENKIIICKFDHHDNIYL